MMTDFRPNTHLVGHTFSSRRVALYRAAARVVQAKMLEVGHNIHITVSGDKAPVRHLSDSAVDFIRYLPNGGGYRDRVTGNPILKDLQRGIVWFGLEREPRQPFSEATKAIIQDANDLLVKELRARRMQFRKEVIEAARMDAARLLGSISKKC